MGLHERAWNGLSICIFGKTPIFPMRMEQALAEVTPPNETRLSSFENYDDAYEFCRSSRDVGLILIEENCGDLPFEQVFRELGRHYEVRGLPCFGVVLHAGDGNLKALRLVFRAQNILDYISIDTLLDKRQVTGAVSSLWENFVAAFEERFIPPALQDVLFSLAETHIDRHTLISYERITNLLAPQLNITWFESVAITWSMVLDTIWMSQPSLFLSNPILDRLRLTAPISKEGGISLIKLAGQRDLSLAARIATCAFVLIQRCGAGDWEKISREIVQHATPGAPALLRHLAASIPRVEDIAMKHSIQRAV